MVTYKKNTDKCFHVTTLPTCKTLATFKCILFSSCNNVVWLFPTIQLHTIINTYSRYWSIFKLHIWIPKTEICWFISIGQNIGNNLLEAHGSHRTPEEDFYMFSISLYKLAIISPCIRAWLFIWKKELPIPKDALCQFWLKTDPVVLM